MLERVGGKLDRSPSRQLEGAGQTGNRGGFAEIFLIVQVLECVLGVDPLGHPNQPAQAYEQAPSRPK